MPYEESELLRQKYCSYYHNDLCLACMNGEPPHCIDNTQMSIISRFLCADDESEKILPIRKGQFWVIDPQNMNDWTICNQFCENLPAEISLLKTDKPKETALSEDYHKKNIQCIAIAMLHYINKCTKRTPNSSIDRDYNANWCYLLLLSPKMFVEGMFNLFYAFQCDICKNTDYNYLCNQLINKFRAITSILKDTELFRKIRSEVAQEFLNIHPYNMVMGFHTYRQLSFDNFFGLTYEMDTLTDQDILRQLYWLKNHIAHSCAYYKGRWNLQCFDTVVQEFDSMLKEIKFFAGQPICNNSSDQYQEYSDPQTIATYIPNKLKQLQSNISAVYRLCLWNIIP